MCSFYADKPESGPYSNPATSSGLIYTGAQIELARASVFTWSQLERLPSTPSIERESTTSSRVPTYRKTASLSRERPLCTTCGNDFGRVQELERHKAMHTTPNRCLFCPMKWTRSDKIRAHLMDKHRDCFSTETWKKLNALRARDLVKFLKLFKHFRDTETTSASPVPPNPLLS